MKKPQFTDQQTAFAVQQAEAGVGVEEVYWKLGISQQTSLSLEEEVLRPGGRRGAALEAV